MEYPFSRGFTHITSPSAYDVPDFDAGFMNDKRDMIPMVWGYIKSRETARRMDAYAGEITNMHPDYAYDTTSGLTASQWHHQSSRRFSPVWQASWASHLLSLSHLRLPHPHSPLTARATLTQVLHRRNASPHGSTSPNTSATAAKGACVSAD